MTSARVDLRAGGCPALSAPPDVASSPVRPSGARGETRRSGRQHRISTQRRDDVVGTRTTPGLFSRREHSDGSAPAPHVVARTVRVAERAAAQARPDRWLVSVAERRRSGVTDSHVDHASPRSPECRPVGEGHRRRRTTSTHRHRGTPDIIDGRLDGTSSLICGDRHTQVRTSKEPTARDSRRRMIAAVRAPDRRARAHRLRPSPTVGRRRAGDDHLAARSRPLPEARNSSAASTATRALRPRRARRARRAGTRARRRRGRQRSRRPMWPTRSPLVASRRAAARGPCTASRPRYCGRPETGHGVAGWPGREPGRPTDPSRLIRWPTPTEPARSSVDRDRGRLRTGGALDRSAGGRGAAPYPWTAVAAELRPCLL